MSDVLYTNSIGLYGSSILPSTMIIGDKEVQLGEVVRRAFYDSNLTVGQWNAMPELARENKLAAAIYRMRKEAEELRRNTK